MIQATTPNEVYQASVTRQQAHRLAERCLSSGSLENASAILERFARRIGNTKQRGTWGYYAKRFATSLRNRGVMFRIFNDSGNTKLPFVAFSTLPLFTCPGAGECATYCYSLRAWRYPAAYFRQLQNTLFMRFAPDMVAEAFSRIRHGRQLRLYVDGDIANLAELRFWFVLLGTRPDIETYGYSKSWGVFLDHEAQGGTWPTNYALNISSGSIYGPEVLERMRRLPITRGEFIAVRTENRHPRDTAVRFSSREYHAEVRAAAREATGNPRVFSCTGKCGTCAKSKHACGDLERFSLVTIAIGIH